MRIKLIIRLIKYALIYSYLTLRGALIWGQPSSVEENDNFLASHYPKEWNNLGIIVRKY